MRNPAVRPVQSPSSGAPSALRSLHLSGELILTALQPLRFVAGQLLVGLLPLAELLGLKIPPERAAQSDAPPEKNG